ncbi:MAG: prephenate dehydrogenase/arogenate dehydrogenase family protein, partial [Clostridiales Family XIII bacterium]|nr:prephenate dehydrogenase/arogenate dehydrogenase family protein [Clostridiales Family XIII bacterium]
MAYGFEHILIIGMGFIGGSLAGALREADETVRIYGVDTDFEAIRTAIEGGLIEGGEAFSPVGDHAAIMRILKENPIDLVVLCTPVDSYPTWFQILDDSDYRGIITDVGSTKEPAIAYAKAHLCRTSSFIAGHPMAGSEVSGIAGARSDLFDGAYWILTPDKRNDLDIHAFRRLHGLLTSIGARVISVDPAEHDRLIAIISHIPHVAASSLVALAGDHAGGNGEMFRLAAGGFKDTTRVAAGSPDLWTGILLNNADIVAEELDEFARIITSMAEMIRNRDAEGVHRLLSEAAEIRKSLPAKWLPESAKLIVV